jgi:AcrR family transcriptional regulator
VARPKKSDDRNTRQNILDAALDLFALNGFFGTSMRDIAKRVGVRESALYHYFDSKAGILEGLLQVLGPGQAFRLAALDVGQVLDGVTPKQFLHELGTNMVSVWASEHESKMFRFILSEGPRLGERDVLSLPNYMRMARAQLSGVFAEMMKRKLIRKADPVIVTMGFIAPLMMLRVLYLVMPKGPPDMKGLQTEVRAFCDHYWTCIQ